MTAEVNRLEEQLRRALEGEAWHGPSVLESLAGLSAAQAASQPSSERIRAGLQPSRTLLLGQFSPSNPEEFVT